MDRTIEAIGDRETELIERLKAECRNIKAEIPEALYSAILFAPSLPDNALGLFIESSRAIVLDDRLSDPRIPFSHVWNVFLHELAHALESAIYGSCTGHGAAFHKCCDILGVEKGFDRAVVKNAIEHRAHCREKIQKLIALSSSSFEEEAATALRMAQKLMAEGSLQNAESSLNDKIYTAVIAESGRISSGCAYLLGITEAATGVFLVRSHTEKASAVRAYGSIEEVEMAIYLYDYLESSVDNEIAKLRKTGNRITRNDFIYGAYSTLMARISGTPDSGKNEIAVLKDRNRALAEKLVFRNTKLRKETRYAHSSSPSSIERGRTFASSLRMPDSIQQKKLQ